MDADTTRRIPLSPLACVLLGMFVLHVAGIGWGMPASDAWEDDGIAPRDFLVGTHDTFLPGQFFTYPPVHLVTLTVITAPVSAYALAHARSFAPSDVIAEFIKVPYMTIFTVIARMISAFMSVGIAYALAKIAEVLHGRRAGLLVAVVVALNAPFTYYAQTSNLDVPYLFWASFALLGLVRAIAGDHPRGLRRAMVFAALAVGTKDQAYALFLLGVPLSVGLWLVLDPSARGKWRIVVRELVIASVLAAALLLLVDGAITNPRGFAHRLAFLLGPASQDHAYYPASWAGRGLILRDLAGGFERFYPWPFALLMLAGIVVHLRRTWHRRRALVAGMVPLLAAASFVICFNFTARRTEHRFELPQVLLLGTYAGIALDELLLACRTRATRVLAAVAVAPLFGWGLFGCVAMILNLIHDPRYLTEAFLSAHVHAGDLIEVYGSNCYLPRFPPGARVERVDLTPIDKRNPLPGMTELEARFEDVEQRKPKWIVVPEAWVWRYETGEPTSGHVLAKGQTARQKDVTTRDYFRSLNEQTRGYVWADRSEWQSTFWPRIDIHASTGRPLRIFERKP